MMVLPANREERILAAIQKLWPELTWPALANEVLALSDDYQKQQAKPWRTRQSAAAYLAYFYPLNYVRLRVLFKEAVSRQIRFETVHDFGSGPQVGLHALADTGVQFRCQVSESELLAHEVAGWLRLGNDPVPDASSDAESLVASYSYSEIPSPPQSWWKARNWLLLEPSTFAASQRLLQLRAELIKNGFRAVSPCTHGMNCPLQNHHRDWCHMRVGFSGPFWWGKLEPHLPMKNRTITFSFLIATRDDSAKPAQGARVIGDTRLEKGKSRQIICQSDKVQEIFWHPQRIQKFPKDFEIPRGSVLQLQEAAEEKIKIEDPRTLQWTELGSS